MFERPIKRNGFFIMSEKSVKEYQDSDRLFYEKLKGEGIEFKILKNGYFKFYIQS